MKKLTENIVRSWITSIFGVILMAAAVVYLFEWVKEITIQNILIVSMLGAVGFVFLFVKDDLILKLFAKLTRKSDGSKDEG